MNQNDKRNDQNNKGGKNLQGVLRLVAWARLSGDPLLHLHRPH